MLKSAIAPELKFFRFTLKFKGEIKEYRYAEYDAAKLKKLADFTKKDDLIEIGLENGYLEEGEIDYITDFQEVSEEVYLRSI